MGLPTIVSYALPGADALPTPRVAWRPERARVALLIHDMQNYFVGAFPRNASPIEPLLANVVALRARCDALDVPVVITRQPGGQEPRTRGLQLHFWGPGMRAIPEHEDIVAELAPRPTDIVLSKGRYSAFQQTKLEIMLARQGRDQLIVCGVFAHIGCLLTAADAFMRDIEPFFVADAVAAFSREQHDGALRTVADCCAVPLMTATVLEQLC